MAVGRPLRGRVDARVMACPAKKQLACWSVTPVAAASISKPIRFGTGMKEALTSFDLVALVSEWQGLIGGYVDKIYQAKDEVILRIHVPGADRRELYCKA